MLTPARKLGPALAAGNSVILKPAPDTPLAAYHLARALDEAGLPGGVLATVITDHDTLGRVVLDDPRVAGVTFTGSTATGRLLQQRLAGRGVRLQTEMGGKNAAVVLADADLDLAVATIGAAAFGQAGQRCTATSRVLVASSIHDEVVGRLAALAQGLVLGRSTEPGTTMGPLVSAVQRERVLAHLSGASGEGLTVVTGGGVPDAESLRHGCFVEPTVLTGMTADKAIWRDEVFGPVIGVRAIGSLDEAVEAVNDSPYGLSASLFTVDLRSANRFVQEVDAGQVAVNLPTSGWDVHQPFGGFKDSGSAFKEQGLEGLRFYTRVKTAAIRSAW
jgi:aldehyde dehydrogenase (NAD+)